MKRLYSLAFLVPLYFTTTANTDSLYQALIAKAGLCHLQKDYNCAIACFEKAFALRLPDALTAYKAAGVYSLDSNADKALYYLQLSIDSGWAESEQVAFDPYFDFVRAAQPAAWKQITQRAIEREAQYAKSVQQPALRKEINDMTLRDQQLRYQRIQAKDRTLRKQIDEQILQSDLHNLTRAKEIIQQRGWPGISAIGKDGQNNFWLIVQHADQDILFQQQALQLMEKLLNSNEIIPENYAFLYDRVQCNLNYKQYYGTQVNWNGNGTASGFRPILQEHMADARRKALGMLPLSLYSLTYGFEYTPVTAAKAAQQDQADLAACKQLMDSAQYYYRKKNFQRTYDLYNEASTIAGGMNNKDNYKAAVLFANIAASTKEQPYKDIALDFLNLLCMRQYLTRNMLSAQKEFTILQKETRWLEMYGQLK